MDALTFAQKLAIMMPLSLVALLMAYANYSDPSRPILSSWKEGTYHGIAVTMTIAGLVGGFGVFESLVPGFHRLFGLYMFAGIIFSNWTVRVSGKSIAQTVNKSA